MEHDIAVIGAGSWGTALAIHLARAGSKPILWVHDPALAAAMSAHRENGRYLPGHPLESAITITGDLPAAMRDVQDVMFVVPSHHARAVLHAIRPLATERTAFCIASKGIENETLMRVSEVLCEVMGPAAARRAAVLSGPSFALEVACGQPTAVVVASPHSDSTERIQSRLSHGNVRAYTNSDMIGVELGGALKNVIAIGAGAVEGLGLGSNTVAALITRGLAEISRLAESLGGRRETLAGLAGLGDLVLTCTGSLSRNRSLGVSLGRGRTLEEALASSPMVVEGVRTTLSAHELARRQGVRMPITDELHALLYQGKRPADAISDLLTRQLTSESG